MSLVIGVDSSTQSCKVVIVDTVTGAIVREGRASHPGGTSVDPEAWWVALQSAIADAGGLEDVAAWAIGGQQHGMVVLDAGGRVIRDALLWNDTRSAGAATDLVSEFGAETLAQRTGLVPVASFTVTKLRWLRDNEPDNAARVAAVALPHDWLTWRLRGFGPEGSPRGPVLEELVTDRSDASGTGYWNPADDGYDRELLAAALGHDAILPRVLGPDEWVLDEAGRRVGPGAGDNAGAALGLEAGPGDVVVSIGTSGTVFAVSEQRTIDATGTVAGFADCTGRFLPLVATLNAARVLDAIAGLLGVDHAELSRLALAAESGAEGLALVPYFEGERTPNLPDATASLTGMTLASTTRENLARAAVEGMLSGLGAGVQALRDLGVPIERALLIGGGAQSEAVRAIAPLVLGVPVEVPEPGEYVAVGAARQAASVLSVRRSPRPASPRPAGPSIPSSPVATDVPSARVVTGERGTDAVKRARRTHRYLVARPRRVDVMSNSLVEDSPDDQVTFSTSQLRTMRDEMQRFLLEYRFGMQEIETKVAILREEFQLMHDYNPIEHVSSRVKSPDSLVEKVVRKGVDPGFESIRASITDIAGVRITCSFTSDAYRLFDLLTAQDDITVVTVKDYIAEPKENGYKSLHAIVEVPVFLSTGRVAVPVEVQFRTIAMDFWASLEHKIYYKYERQVPDELLASLKDAADTAAELDERMQRLHRELHGPAAKAAENTSSARIIAI